jgi:glycosyltransferase involved in cell wall biosynthesis
VPIALDATYSLGSNLSGVGVYSRKILFGLAQAHPDVQFSYLYRSNRLFRSLKESLPPNARRRLLHGIPRANLFHALNQRVSARGGPTVATFHDLFVMTGEYSSPDFRARFTEQATEAARNSDRIIAVSEFTAQQVEALLEVPSDRIDVVPHGVDLPREASGLPRENLVLFAGAIQKRKNIARLVRAFRALPSGWRLVLAGSPDGYGAAEELRAVEESPRKSDIKVAGYVSRGELEDLYSRASIFAFPSLDEGFGMPVLEAMAYGVPVLTSSRSALPEVAGGAALLADPEREDELAEGLVKLASDAALRATLIERGRARAQDSSWTKTLARTWEVYLKLL